MFREHVILTNNMKVECQLCQVECTATRNSRPRLHYATRISSTRRIVPIDEASFRTREQHDVRIPGLGPDRSWKRHEIIVLRCYDWIQSKHLPFFIQFAVPKIYGNKRDMPLTGSCNFHWDKLLCALRPPCSAGYRGRRSEVGLIKSRKPRSL